MSLIEDCSPGEPIPPDAPDDIAPCADSESSPSTDWSRSARAFFSISGIICPILCFAVASLLHRLPNSPVASEASIQDYALGMLSWKATVVFSPLIAFSIFSLSGMLSNPRRWGSEFYVRLGLGLGIGLSIQYLAIVVAVLSGQQAPSILNSLGVLVTFGISFFINASVLWGIRKGLRFASSKLGVETVWILAGTLGSASFVLMLVLGSPELTLILPLLFAFAQCILFSTWWSLLCYITMFVHTRRYYQSEDSRFTLRKLFAIMTLIAIYCGAWRLSIDLVNQTSGARSLAPSSRELSP